MPELSPPVARLREHLEQLDVPSSTLKRDPWGETWLPAELKALVEADADCREELRRFVDRELELFGSVRQRNDAMFAARVSKATEHVEIAGAGLDPRIRSWILGLFYALATVVAYVVFAPWIGLADRVGVVASIQGALGLGGEAGVSAWGLALVIVVAVAALAAALVPWGRTSLRP